MVSRDHSTALIIATLGCAVGLGVSATRLSAQVSADILQKYKADLEKQTTDPDQKREGGTQPRDWSYDLPAGVTTRQVTFFVDGGTALYGKMFFPRNFSMRGTWPAVVVGHGVNALSIGIEKYAARFADRGLVAMAVDYQSYGFSGSGSDDLRLLEADATTDDRPVTEKTVRLLLKRTNLNNVHEVADFRAAVSFLQGEPGVDPDRIGIWGSSNGGGVVTAVAGVDARVKAVVAQVSTPRPGARRAVNIAPAGLEDAIVRVRQGQGAEVDGGFSFRSKIDQWSNTRNQDVQAGARLDQVATATDVLFLPAEKDTVVSNETHAVAASKVVKGPTGITTIPGAAHAMSGAAADAAAIAAAAWFARHL